MPLTAKGKQILEHMEKTYGSREKAEEVLYASKNAGTITGIDSDENGMEFDAKLDAMGARCAAYDAKK